MQQEVAFQVKVDPSQVAAWNAYAASSPPDGASAMYAYAVYRSPQDPTTPYGDVVVRTDQLVISNPNDWKAPSPVGGGTPGVQTITAEFQVGPSSHDAPQADAHLVGFGYIFEPDDATRWVHLPSDDTPAVGQVGMTDASVCEWYWGEKIANTPMGGVGTAVPEADRAGESWVGEDSHWSSDGKALISNDGLRQWRPPTYKPNLGIYQSNFQWRLKPKAEWQGDGHLTITDMS